MQDPSDGGSDDDNEDDANLMDTGDDLEAVKKEVHGLVEKKQKKTKLDRLFARKNSDVLSTAFEKIRAHDTEDRDSEGSGNDSDEFLTKKRPRQETETQEDKLLTKKKPRQGVEEVEGKQMKAKRYGVKLDPGVVRRVLEQFMFYYLMLFRCTVKNSEVM